MKKTAKKRPRSPESQILQQARQFGSQSGISRSPFVSIRPNGTCFPSVNQPFKPVMATHSAPSASSIRNFCPPSKALSTTTAAALAPSEEEEEDREQNWKEEQPNDDDEGGDEEEEDAADGMEERNGGVIKVKPIMCQMSQLQRELHDAVNGLMTLTEEEQNMLNAKLFNHPSLLYERIRECSDQFEHLNGKKAKKRYENYYGVLCKFPTAYQDGNTESMHRIDESGKLAKLVDIVKGTSQEEENNGEREEEEEDEPEQRQNRVRLIVASRYAKTLNVLERVLDTLKPAPLLNMAVYRVNPNMASTVRHIHLQTIRADPRPKLVLLNVKTENLPPWLFTGARFIFFDFNSANDGKIVADLAGTDVLSVHKLVTAGTIEAEFDKV